MDPQLQVSWDSYQNNICRGLGLLQQKGEFVDMTLAADGHHVKVHQMVLSLISPFIKELISSAHCPHPVVFLNKVSYQTLKSILEYAYTGEVLVTRERLGEFLEACKALQIKGLETDSMTAPGDGSLIHVNEDIKTTADAAFLHKTETRDIQELEESYQPAYIQDTELKANIKLGVKRSASRHELDDRKRSNISAIDDNDPFYDDGHTMDDSHIDNDSTDYNEDSEIILDHETGIPKVKPKAQPKPQPIPKTPR